MKQSENISSLAKALVIAQSNIQSGVLKNQINDVFDSGYADLGAKYAAAGQHTDAARAYVKAIKHSPNKVEPSRQAWDNLRDAWQELW